MKIVKLAICLMVTFGLWIPYGAVVGLAFLDSAPFGMLLGFGVGLLVTAFEWSRLKRIGVL